MKIPVIILFTIFNLLLVSSAASQIYFKNNNPESVYVAFAQYKADTRPGYWITRGWFTVNSGKTFTAFETISPNDSIAYWATTLLSGTVFEGKKQLLVHNDEKFMIKNADKEWVLKQHPQYEWRNFRLIRMKPGTVTGTIKL